MRTVFRGHWILWGALLWQLPAHARIAIHVRGTSVVEANATISADSTTLVVQGRLKDELGTPIVDAPIWLSAGLRALPFRSCATPTNALLPTASSPHPIAKDGTPMRATTGVDGGFCVEVRRSDVAVDTPVQLHFDGSPTYEESSLRLDLRDLRLTLAANFGTLAHRVSLDEPTTSFQLSVTPLSGTHAGGEVIVSATLSLAPPDSESTLAPPINLTLPLGRSTPVVLSTHALGAPGIRDLVVRIGGTQNIRPFEARHRVLLASRVQVEPLHLPLHAVRGDKLELACACRNVRGAVPFGAVELTIDAERHQLAAVHNDGTASFVITTPRNQTSLALAFRYVSDREGYEAGTQAYVNVALSEPSLWRFGIWTAAGLLVLAWLAWARRRPPPLREEPRPQVPQIPGAHVELLGPPSRGHVQWEGVVLDAHEATPLISARIALLQPNFGTTQVLHVTSSDAAGGFTIPVNVVPAGSSCKLVVQADAHATFSTRLPAPGQLRIYLVSTRRAILDRLVEWSRGRGSPFRGKSEPSPDWVAQVARLRGYRDIEHWAQAVSTAAFGVEVPSDDQKPELLPPTGPFDGTAPLKPPES